MINRRETLPGSVPYNLSSRTAFDGGTNPQSGSRGVTQYYAGNVVPLPLGSIARVSPFEGCEPLQTSIDVFALLFWLLYLTITITGYGFAFWALVIAIRNSLL